MPPVKAQTLLNDPRVISKVRLITHTLGKAGPTTSYNHWSIFFIISEKTDEEDSVRVNMTAPDYEKLTGELQWGDHSYIMSNSAIHYWDFQVAASFTVASIVSLLSGLNRHEYDMSGGGSGCRWWCYTVICDLAEWGYIGPGEPGRLHPDMFHQYHKSLARKPLNMPKGEFFPRIIAQPLVYRSNSNPPQDIVPFDLNGQRKRTLLSDWVFYEDHNRHRFLRHARYNLCFNYPNAFQYAT